MQKPQFSIILTCYNREKYIKEAIESVLCQTFSNWELIIIDDASTDNSIKVIESYLAKNSRIKLVINQKNIGLSKSLRKGVRYIKSDIFGALDSDDTLTPNAIEVMYKAHQENPDCGLIYSQFMWCDEKLNVLEEGYCRQIPQGKSNLNLNVVSQFRTYKKKYYDLTHGFHDNTRLCEDKDMSFKMEEVAPTKFIDEAVYLVRKHKNHTLSQNESARPARLAFEVVKSEAVARRQFSIILPVSSYLTEERQKHLDFVRQRYERLFPHAQIIIGKDDTNNTKFCKSRAVNNGVSLSVYDNLLIADIDMIIDPYQIYKSLIQLHKYGWIIPYKNLFRLDQKETEHFLNNYTIENENDFFNRKDLKAEIRYNIPSKAGGLQLVKKSMFNKVSGYDENFIGWGGEDTSFLAALEKVYTKGINLEGDAYHLYHIRNELEIDDYNRGNNNKKLRDKYWNKAVVISNNKTVKSEDNKNVIDVVNINHKKVYFYAQYSHYFDHLFDIWKNLPDIYKETFFVSNSYDNDLYSYARKKDPAIKLINKKLNTKDIVVAANVIKDEIGEPSIILVNHGAGQSYITDKERNSSYAGGKDRDNVILFIHPNEYAANLDKEKYPSSKQAIVGCCKLDVWHQKKLAQEIKQRQQVPVIAISFHWDCKVCPETRSAWNYYHTVLPMLANKNISKEWEVLGHAHPRILSQISPTYKDHGIEVVENFDDIMSRADLYICDHMSTLYEFASTDRPVVVLNMPWYRKHIEHGLRFWEHADVGINVDHPKELETGILRALQDPLEQKMLREKACNAVYSYRDGIATNRAVEAIVELLNQTDYAGGSVSEKVNITPEKKRILNSEGMYRRWFGTPRKRR